MVGVFDLICRATRDSGTLGLRVRRFWLSYRTKKRKSKKFSSDQNKIRPAPWTQTNEPLLLSSMIEHTIDVAPQAAELLNAIVNSPLIPGLRPFNSHLHQTL